MAEAAPPHPKASHEPAAFYRQLDDDRFSATGHTVGPWSAEMQHMGPPSALLTRELERRAGAEGMLARITVEVLGAVPPGEMTASGSVLRSGRTIELVGAELDVQGRAVARAAAWRLADHDTTAVQAGAPDPMPPGLRGSELPPGWVPGYLDALQWRWITGDFGEQGPGSVWARPLVAVVEGEEPTPLQRLMSVVDSANGIASPLHPQEWLFLNTDLTVHLFRQPVGEWMGVQAATTVGPTGVGVCSGVLHDEQGPIGRSAQILTVRPR